MPLCMLVISFAFFYVRAVPALYEYSAGTARRDGSTMSDVFSKVTPVENIYLLLQNSRHTYAADYHYHAAQTDAPLSAHYSLRTSTTL